LKEAEIIGIVVCTLSVTNFLDILAKVKAAIKAAGKTFYEVLVGKMNEAKLANFQFV
jgi:diphthamide biosynthesis protein 2